MCSWPRVGWHIISYTTVYVTCGKRWYNDKKELDSSSFQQITSIKQNYDNSLFDMFYTKHNLISIKYVVQEILFRSTGRWKYIRNSIFNI